VAAFQYEVVTHNRNGKERRHEYTSDDPLEPGAVVFLEGRYWLLERVERDTGDAPGQADAKPARYRIRLVHPDRHQEVGAFRRFRPDAPRLGHFFTTIEGGALAGWEAVGEQLAFDERGEPYLDLRAERDYAEAEGDIPDHELEHAREQQLPERAGALLARGAERGLLVELVALEPGEDPDWNEAAIYIDALVIDEIEDDLLELCRVEPNRDPPETWLAKVQERLRSDLELFRTDVEGEHHEVEEWDFRGGRIFATTGSYDDEADPIKGHGWMCRLVDAGALAAARFARVRKSELDLLDE
jgi:hypothetical protein